MLKKITLGLLAIAVVFLSYVATRESKFHYERSGIINASKEKIYPYISNLRLGSQWSPYEKMAPEMKKNFTGEDGKVGSKMDFESKEAGSGSVEITGLNPNESVDIKLIMTAPLKGENIIQYKLTPEGENTRFTWAMSGDGGFIGKLISVLIDCEKMVGGQFSDGIQNLKTLVESQK